MEDLDLTVVEKHFLEASFDSTVTRRRQRRALLFGLVTLLTPIVVGRATQSWVLVAATMMLYVAISIWEKNAYGNGVLVYKSVIRKLHARLEDSESERA
jgi:hypothetical protein